MSMTGTPVEAGFSPFSAIRPTTRIEMPTPAATNAMVLLFAPSSLWLPATYCLGCNWHGWYFGIVGWCFDLALQFRRQQHVMLLNRSQTALLISHRRKVKIHESQASLHEQCMAGGGFIPQLQKCWTVQQSPPQCSHGPATWQQLKSDGHCLQKNAEI